MKYVKHLPSLPGYPFIGSGYMFIGKNTKGKKVKFISNFLLRVVLDTFMFKKFSILETVRASYLEHYKNNQTSGLT